MNPYGMDKISGLNKEPRYRVKPLRFDEFLAVYSAFYQYRNNQKLYFPPEWKYETATVDIKADGRAHVDFGFISPIPLFIFNEYFEKFEKVED